MSKIHSLDDAMFSVLVGRSKSYTEVLKSLGLSSNGGTSSKVLKARIDKLNLSTGHFLAKPSPNRTTQSLGSILVAESKYTNIARLKIRLVREGLMEYICSGCGNRGEWLGNPMTLQLDHINGISNDHRLNNLRFLCPNCHSQTDTYSGRNK